MMVMDKDRQPLVSVIIPTYNRRNTLPSALHSVLNQTYNTLEVIIVDDGSDDGTEEYVSGVADSRVKYVKTVGNKGPSAARNLGVRLAQGEYVAFQDSDDEWLSDKLEKQMSLFGDSEKDTGMVYCEFTRYRGRTRQGVTPSKEIPYEYKQGNIFRVLLLQPLIGTSTVVIKRQDFISAGGFNETLKTFEDYEFTLRFSRNHAIGFVEESLVKVYDSPNSVNKRCADRFRTQAYIVREMIEPLREYDLLWEKLSLMQSEAEYLNCHDIFLEELQRLADLFVTEQERRRAAELLEKTEQSDARKNQLKGMAKQELESIKQQILKTYLKVYRDAHAEPETITDTLQQVRDKMAECIKLFQIPTELQSTYEQIEAMRDPGTKVERLFLLTDVVKAVESVEAFIGQQMYECNVCGRKVFRNESAQCPFCKADHRERIAIAFLQELRPEAEEKLNMLQLMPSTLQDNYAFGRTDILYDRMSLSPDDLNVLHETEDGKYDIIVCPTFWDEMENIPQVIKELYRVMKPGGVGLAAMPLEGSGQGCTEQLREAGFDVNEVGENWFGEEFYQQHGFDKRLVLYVFTLL